MEPLNLIDAAMSALLDLERPAETEIETSAPASKQLTISNWHDEKMLILPVEHSRLSYRFNILSNDSQALSGRSIETQGPMLFAQLDGLSTFHHSTQSSNAVQ